MKPMTLLLTALLISVPAAFAQEEMPPDGEDAAQAAVPEQELTPAELAARASYGLGLQMGRNFKFQEFDVDLEQMLQGLKDGLAGAQPRFSNDEMQTAIQASQEAASTAIAARNRALGEAFLAANSKKQGVYVLESGLQYQVINEGSGPKPTAEDTVRVHFRSSLVDGTELDNSFEGEPQSHTVSNLIPAWVEALELMPVGSRWRLFVHPDLGHGDRGAGRIGPGAVTIFELELLGIEETEAASEAGGGGTSGEDAEEGQR